MLHRLFTVPMMLSMAGMLPIPECGSELSPVGDGVELRMARSTDGVTFERDGQAAVTGARSPAIVYLPNGRLAAMAEYGTGVHVGSAATMVSFSADDGASWSEPDVVRVVDARGGLMTPRGGTLVCGPDGRMWLYFLGWSQGSAESRPAGSQPTTGQSSEAVLFSAVTKDGVNYRVESAMPLPVSLGYSARLAAVGRDKEVDLYLTVRAQSQGSARQQVLLLVSRDGRRFEPAGLRELGPGSVDSVVRVARQGYRAYLSAEQGVHSFVSGDGLRWKPEEGVRLPDGQDAAVVQLKDGSFLMLYCAKVDGASKDVAGASSQPSAGAISEAGSTGAQSAGTTAVVVEGQGGNVQAGSGGGKTDPLVGSLSNVGRKEGMYPGHQSNDAGNAEVDSTTDTAPDEAIEQLVNQIIPPMPDFTNPVDYLSWMSAQFPSDIEGNAYSAYEAFLPFFHVSPTDEPEQPPAWWPKKFNDEFYGPNAGPWLPEEHSDWENMHQLLQVPLKAFRDATMLPNFSHPFDFGPQGNVLPDGDKLLIDVLLPGLASCRTMVKATLADAWRVEGGRVDPARMTDAWKAALGNARQMHQGFCTIQSLVGTAEAGLVESDARLALKHGVFQTAEEIENALNVLKQADRSPPDAPRWIGTEAAMGLQMTQYLFTPASANGQPQINMDRVKQVMKPLGWQDNPKGMDLIASLGPEEAYQTVEALGQFWREYARLYHAGYPGVRSADMEALANKYIPTTVITKTLLPSLTRVYDLTTRAETSRRATQLTYEVHLFKARNGRWPASLDELGLPAGARERTDPFTGGDFTYQLTGDGPRIATRGENQRDDGVHAPNWSDKVKTDQDPDDYIFWPVQK